MAARLTRKRMRPTAMPSPAKAISAPTGSGGSARTHEDRSGDLRQLAAALAPLGITKNDKGEADGTDIEPTITAGAPWVSLGQDGTRYFDYHHTPDDTLDKIDPAQLRQNVAAWTTMLACCREELSRSRNGGKRR